MNSGTPAAACLLWGYQKSGTVKEGELIRGQAQGTRKFDWYPLFRSTNLCYGPARSGEGIYCVSALKDKEPADKNPDEIHILGAWAVAIRRRAPLKPEGI